MVPTYRTGGFRLSGRAVSPHRNIQLAFLRRQKLEGIALYESSRDYLKEHAPKQESSDGKVRFKTPSIKLLRAEKEKLTLLKNQQYEDFSYVRAKYRELQTVANNVNQILDLDTPVQKEHQQEQSRASQAKQRTQQEEKSSQEQKNTGQSL